MPPCVKCGHDPDAIVLRAWSFVVDRDPPTLNDRVFNAGAVRWRYARERDAWQWEFRAARLLQRIPPAMKRRRLTLTRCYFGRQRSVDRDNLVGGMKMLVDAMVREGMLKDDSANLAEIHYLQEQTTPRGLRVLIEELG